MSKIAGHHPALYDALERALGIDRNYVRRVVIDIQAGEPVTVHVQMLGDESIIEVIETLSGLDITRVIDGGPEQCLDQAPASVRLVNGGWEILCVLDDGHDGYHQGMGPNQATPRWEDTIKGLERIEREQQEGMIQ